MKVIKHVKAEISKEMDTLRDGLLQGQSLHDEYLRICGLYKGLQIALEIMQRYAKTGEDDDDDEDEPIGTNVDEYVHN
jgi:hypothetical protein